MRFWDLIDQARGTCDPDAPSAQPEALRTVLDKLSDEDVLAFGVEITNQICRLNHWRLWGAGVSIFPDMSGDSFHYFRAWIVGKGETVTELALADPDALAPHIDDPEIENELLEYVALEVLEARGVEIDPRSLAGDADADPTGDPYDEATLVEDYPRLMGRFG